MFQALTLNPSLHIQIIRLKRRKDLLALTSYKLFSLTSETRFFSAEQGMQTWGEATMCNLWNDHDSSRLKSQTPARCFAVWNIGFCIGNGNLAHWRLKAKTIEPRLVTTIWLLCVNKTSVYSWFRTFPTVYRIVYWFSISQTLPIIVQLLKLPAQTFSLESLLELWQSRGYHDSILSLFRNELRHQKLPSWNWNKKFRVCKWVTEMTHHHLRMSENVNNWIIMYATERQNSFPISCFVGLWWKNCCCPSDD